MNYKRKKYGLLIIAVLLLVSVGYALINTTLKLNGSSKIKKARWDIYFDKVEHESGVTSTETKIDDKKTTVSFDIDLEKPGDYYQFNVDTVNDGTIDAIIDSTELTGLSNTTKEIIDYTVTYSDGSSVNKCDTLNSGDRKTLLVKVKYFDDVKEEDLLDENENLKLKFKINYVQTGACSRNPILEIDPNGGKYNDSRKITKRNVEKNSSLTIPEAQREGYNFVNWKTSTGVDLEKDSETKLTTINVETSDIKVIAQWEKAIDPVLIKHVVTIDPNGGLYNDSEQVITYQKKKNETVEVNGTIQREGYIFKGWEVDPANSQFVGNVLTVGTTDVTITAKWELDQDKVVAKIENKYYTTLQKAFNAAKTNDKIELLKDIEEVSTNTKEVSLDLGNHTINGTINNSGILTVDNGKIQNLTEGQAPIVNTGTIIIGTNDERVIQDSIILYGKTTGLLQNGQFYFYDGYIEGDIAFKGGYNGCANGYIVYVDHDNILNCQKAYLALTPENAVVKVKSYNGASQTEPQLYLYFFSLKDAISVTNNDNPDVYALKSFSDSEDITVAEGQILNINLEGYTIREGAHITNNGTLTIKDTNENHGTFRTETYSIINNGVFNLSNVNVTQTMNNVNTLENNGDMNFSNSTIQSINGYALNNKTTGNLTFTNDTYFISTGGYSFYNDSAEQINLTGGNFVGIHNKGNNLIINGSTISNPTNKDAIYNEQGSITLKNVNATTTNKYVINNRGTVNVESGVYESTSAYAFYNYSNLSTINITGGIIKSGSQSTIYSYGNVNVSGTTTNISNSYNNGRSIYANGKITIDGGTITSSNGNAIYLNSGTLTINGGNISNTSSYPTINTSSGTIGILGGNISSNNNTAITINGETTVNIKDGEVHGKIYGISVNSSYSKLNLGNDDDIIDPDLPDYKPVIIGDTYGIYVSNGTFNFYDGIIKGKNENVYYGNISESADGTEIVKDTEVISGETYHTAHLYSQEDFLQVGDNTYNSLKKAINAISTTGTIVAFRDGYVSSASTISSSKDITLDLSGNKIVSSASITNLGKLTIEDNKENPAGKTGTIENNSSSLIYNKKTLVINDGIFKSNNNYSIYQEGGSYSDDQHITTINNGKFINSGSQNAIYIRSGSLDIEGGDFTSDSSAIYIYNSKSNTIKNATIKSNNSYAINNYYSSLIVDNVDINNSKQGVYNGSTGSLNISNSRINTTNEAINNTRGGVSGTVSTSITNCTVTSDNIAINNDSNLTFNSGSIIAQRNGIQSSGNLIIKSGTVYGKTYGIYATSRGEITIGTDDMNVPDVNSPIITGDSYGIYDNYISSHSSSSVINFYDGIIKSKGTQTRNGINTTPEGYIAVEGIDAEDSTYKTMYLAQQEPFIEVDGHVYSSLQKAINAAGNSNTMTLVRDGIVTNSSTIDSNQNIILELDGHTMTVTKTITNNGAFTINDNSTGKILINVSSNLIDNNNSLTINGGYLSSVQNTINVLENGVVTINDGTIKSTNNSAIKNAGSVTIEDGFIDSDSSNIINSNNGNLSINGGTIGVIDKNYSNYGVIMQYSNTEINIRGADTKVYGGISLAGNSNKIPTLNIYNGLVYSNSTNISAIDLNQAKANINGGKVESINNSGLYLRNNSTLYVEGGEIIGKKYGIHQYSGTTTLGNNDSEIKVVPIIKGDLYGLYNQSGNFYFYDGVLKGKTEGYYGNVTKTADNTTTASGTEVDSITGDTYKTKFLQSQDNYVRNKTTLVEYNDLQQAITIANSGDELELINNASIYSSITVPNKTIKLNMNNYNISITNSITNNGVLTIVDENTSGQKGKLSTTGAFNLITNNNNLTINNISIENNYENYAVINNTDSSSTTLNNVDIVAKYGIDNRAGSTLTLVDTNITTPYYSNIYNYGGTVDITRGTFSGGEITFAQPCINLSSSISTPGSVIIRNANLQFSRSSSNVISTNGYDTLKIYNTNITGNISNATNGDLLYDGGTINGSISNIGNMKINGITLVTNYQDGIYNASDISNKIEISNSNITINSASKNGGIKNIGNMEVKDTNITVSGSSDIYAIGNSSSGKIKVLGGNIDVTSSYNSYGIKNDTTSTDNNIFALRTLKVHGGNTAYGIYNINGTLTLISGDVETYDSINSYGIYQTGGEVILGTYDGSGTYSADVSTVEPMIKGVGTTTGIGAKRTDGIFRFFDGRIIGSTSAKPEAPTQIEPNYVVQTYTDITTGYEYAILECLSQKSETDIVDWNVKVNDNDIIKSRTFSIDNISWKDTNGNPVSQLQYGAIGNITIKIDGTSMNNDFKYKITVSMADGSPIEVTNNNIEETMYISTETEKSYTIVLNCSSTTADYTTIDKNVPVIITIEKVD